MKITKEDLHELYYEKGLTQDEIGKMYQVTGTAIRYYMRKYGFPRVYNRHKEPIPKDTLVKLYLEEKRGIREVAKILGVSQHKVRTSLKKHGINIRAPWEQFVINRIKKRKESS
jgi:DNA-binding transcriptional regulator LsrR (DeoR family)